MPSSTKSKVRKRKKSAATPKSTPQPAMATQVSLAVAAGSGALLGLSAPGFNHWYIAWFGLVPLLLLIVSSPGIKDAFLRGCVFGMAYNLVYVNWYLQLHPLTWMGFNELQSGAIATAAWMVVSAHQAILVGIIAAIVRFLPLCGGFLPRDVDGRWCIPALLVIPPIWVLLQNKIYNAHDWLGVPWPMLEYSQYHMLPIIQSASWIGGIGIGALIVLFNCSLACLVATLSRRLTFKSFAASTPTAAITQFLTVSLVLAGMVAWGYSRLTAPLSGPIRTASVVQGNINIEMQKRERNYTLAQLMEHYRGLIDRVPSGLCIWTESALPAYLKQEGEVLTTLAQLSRDGKREMIIGSLDKDFNGRPFNSAFGLASDGRLVDAVYHKRYLVPFGEYMPNWVRFMPSWMQRLTSTPAGVGFNAGKKPVVLDLDGHSIAPLICFETISPELCVSSVRNGGELLVNLSDLAWFHKSICGDQMVAFSVMRAAETGRYFVFAANTGPSTIIDPAGRIIARSSMNTEAVLTSRIRYNNELTPFVQWFH
jgi:apolipoprotein N-acyltransferase